MAQNNPGQCVPSSIIPTFSLASLCFRFVAMVRPRVGRQSNFRPWNDVFLYNHRSHGAEIHNKKMAQNEYDIMLRDWPGSREPTDANGQDLPLREVVPDNHPHWRVRQLADLLPSDHDVDVCRFNLDDLSTLSP
jgi:hypothetical protein